MAYKAPVDDIRFILRHILPFDQIADTQPDVILAAYSGLTQEDYDTLSKIAPVVAYPDVAWGTSYQDMIRINILGLLFTAKAALPFLKETQGHLLMTGSAAGRIHLKGSVYGASKWFVHGYGGNLAEEMREWGGRCTVIAPGMVDTEFFDEAKPKAIRPDEVAHAALYALEAGDHAAVREVFLMPR